MKINLCVILFILCLCHTSCNGQDKYITGNSISEDKIVSIKNILEKDFGFPIDSIKFSKKFCNKFILWNRVGTSSRTTYGDSIIQNKDFILIEFHYVNTSYHRREPHTWIIYFPLDKSKYSFIDHYHNWAGLYSASTSFQYGDSNYNIVDTFTNSWDNWPILSEIYSLLFDK